MLSTWGQLGGNTIEAVSVPVGFGYSPSYTFSKTGNVYSTDFDIAVIKPAATVTYYVDPVNGVDAASGTSRITPLKSLSVGLAKTDVDKIIIINLVGDTVVRSTVGWNGTNVTRSVSVINETPQYRYVTAFASGTLPTFTVNGTYSNVYESTTTAPSRIVDIASKTYPVHPRTGASLTTMPAMFLVMTNVASVAAVNATAGTWFHDGTKLYVRLFNDRTAVGDTKLIKTLAGSNGRAGSTTGTTVYVEGVDFVGGTPFNYATALAATTGTVAFNDCTFQAASAGLNGLAIKGLINAHLYRCGAYFNDEDGYNYHSFQSDGTTTGTSPTWFENECSAKGNGTTGSVGGSSNASTSHDYSLGIRLNCIYVDSDDRVVADTNFAESWNLGIVVGHAIKQVAAEENICFLTNAKGWLDGCDAVTTGSANPPFIAAQSAVLKYRNMSVMNAGTAEATGTIATY